MLHLAEVYVPYLNCAPPLLKARIPLSHAVVAPTSLLLTDWLIIAPLRIYQTEEVLLKQKKKKKLEHFVPASYLCGVFVSIIV